ncbi:MAG: class I SAM-dependent methyltransferase [Thermofilaceae archaeon]
MLEPPFDLAAPVYDKGRIGWYRGLLDLLGDRVSEPFLDAGCGTGYIACSLGRRGVSTIVCLDLSLSMLKLAWRRARKWRVDVALHLVAGSLAALPFRGGVFKSALAAAVIHHVYKRERRVEALRELRRVCTGFILITLWSALTPLNVLRVLAARSRDIFVKWGGEGVRYYHLYTPYELEEDMRAAGYERFKMYPWDYKRRVLKRNIVVEINAQQA